MPSGRQEPTYTDLLSGFGAHADSIHGFGASFVDQTAASASRKLILDQEGKFNLPSSHWSVMSSGLSLKLPESNAKVPVQGRDMPFQARGHIRCSAFNELPMLNGHRVEQSHGNWLMPPPPHHLILIIRLMQEIQVQNPFWYRSMRLGNPPMESVSCLAFPCLVILLHQNQQHIEAWSMSPLVRIHSVISFVHWNVIKGQNNRRVLSWLMIMNMRNNSKVVSCIRGTIRAKPKVFQLGVAPRFFKRLFIEFAVIINSGIL